MVSIIFNENHSRYLEVGRFVIVSEVSIDVTGVTLHFRPYEDTDFTEDLRISAHEVLKKLFPQKFVEKFQVRISLGEWIDLVSKIK